MDMNQLEQILQALPDPAFIISRSGKYIAIFGGRDSRYYHESSSLIGRTMFEVMTPEKARWFVEKIHIALDSTKMLIEEYELSRSDIRGIPPPGPDKPVWFEGRIQPLDFTIDNEPVVLWVASNISERHHLELSLRYLSDTDPLTGLHNRRKLERELSIHFSHFTRYKTPTSILMLDLDNFKSINDKDGHDAGDKVLVMLADVCRYELRESDIACRFGGDEFMVVLPNTSSEHANDLAKRLHHRFIACLQQSIPTALELGLSVGVASFETKDVNYENAIKRADRRLYIAKKNGKNEVVEDSYSE